MTLRIWAGALTLTFMVAGCSNHGAPSPAGAPPAVAPAVDGYGVLSRGALPGVLPPQAHPYGKSYGEWNAEWWKWALSVPNATHPLSQTGEVDLSIGQSGNVWFLGGAFASGVYVRRGAIPAGTALFLPIINRSYVEDARVANGQLPTPFTGDTLEYPLSLATYRSLTTLLDASGRPVASNLSLSIDGKAATQEDLLAYLSESPIFELPLLPGSRFDGLCAVDMPTEDVPGTGLINNCWRVDTSRLQAFAQGYYVFIPPLSVGAHTIRFTGRRGVFTLDVTYHLTVEPRN